MFGHLQVNNTVKCELCNKALHEINSECLLYAQIYQHAQFYPSLVNQ